MGSLDRGTTVLMRRLRDTLIFVVTMVAVVTPAVAIGLVTGAAVLASPEVAQASPQGVIRDCAQDGKLDHQYSLSDLKKAEQQLPSDVDEYTNCRDVINQAEVAGSGGHAKASTHGAISGAGPGSGGGGNAAASANDVQALAHATKRAGGSAPTLSLGGQSVEPGGPGVFRTAGTTNSLPTPILLALIAMALLTAGGGLVALGRRFPEVIGAASRIFRR
jgi:hypothetical protein